MRFATAATALALVSTAFAADFVVNVGNNGSGNGLFFSPNSITANVSDTVTFVFNTNGTNHTVVQSLFAKPCEPAAGGFASGYIPGSVTDPKNFTLVVGDTKPIWFYCAQTTRTHCIAGMVGAINPPASPATNDLSAFVALATGASSIVQPTQLTFAPLATATAIVPSAASNTSATSTSAAKGTNAAAPGAKGVSGGVVAALAAAFGVALL
ncbi:hypothetical protein GSI_00189 [Ganoderma sinense ZZ0214-1]|uniref:Blue (type 1) copper domain-containing protein n=1 Tax=Ganoderma sinense ZZ0214-1 TaxID=1077348 RepID=A0A2G8SRW6_9APHY|nr:hypothetical protein GSI_00189 [Ganoderma sinense ZZ0214-1]